MRLDNHLRHKLDVEGLLKPGGCVALIAGLLLTGCSIVVLVVTIYFSYILPVAAFHFAWWHIIAAIGAVIGAKVMGSIKESTCKPHRYLYVIALSFAIGTALFFPEAYVTLWSCATGLVGECLVCIAWVFGIIGSICGFLWTLCTASIGGILLMPALLGALAVSGLMAYGIDQWEKRKPAVDKSADHYLTWRFRLLTACSRRYAQILNEQVTYNTEMDDPMRNMKPYVLSEWFSIEGQLLCEFLRTVNPKLYVDDKQNPLTAFLKLKKKLPQDKQKQYKTLVVELLGDPAINTWAHWEEFIKTNKAVQAEYKIRVENRDRRLNARKNRKHAWCTFLTGKLKFFDTYGSKAVGFWKDAVWGNVRAFCAWAWAAAWSKKKGMCPYKVFIDIDAEREAAAACPDKMEPNERCNCPPRDKDASESDKKSEDEPIKLSHIKDESGDSVTVDPKVLDEKPKGFSAKVDDDKEDKDGKQNT